jgi:hypothetical protein
MPVDLPPIDLPEFTPPPAAVAHVEGELPEPVGVDRGDTVPAPLVVNGKAAVGYVAVPLSDYADALNTESWSRALWIESLSIRATLTAENAVLRSALAEPPAQPVRTTPPAVYIGVGAVTVLAAVFGTGYVLHAIETTP